MKIAVDIGHNVLCSNGKHDIGASGFAQEDDLTLEVGELVISKLEQLGHIVVNTLPNQAHSVSDSLKQRVNTANWAKADLFISIHFNAFYGKAWGTEAFAISSAGAGIAQSITNKIYQLGFFNRGVKRANFYVLTQTKMPAVLVECCFIDNYKDMQIFNSAEMANAIVSGLVGELPPNIRSNPATLKITHQTWLKPSTEQSSTIPHHQLKSLPPGEYSINFLGFEEQHYLVQYKNSDYFVYSGHAEILTEAKK